MLPVASRLKPEQMRDVAAYFTSRTEPDTEKVSP
jgi:hypothetical protein